jgi:hypothetical protein
MRYEEWGRSDSKVAALRRYDYASTRKVLLLCALAEPRPDAVLLIRDLDNQPVERRKSIELARDQPVPAGFVVVLALANTKREAWVLNGSAAGSDFEETTLTAVRAELSFDPCHQSENLDATEPGAKRDAKRVLKLLTNGEPEREERCWMNASWDLLRTRGQGSGLASFLKEAKNRLVPLLTGQPVD